MSAKAHISVYLQALGAHYLGLHAFNAAAIHIQLVYSEGTINMPYNLASCFTSDGNPSTDFTAGASSFMPIITSAFPPAIPGTQVHFLSPDFTTACAQGDFKLPAKPEFAHLEISVPTTSASPMQMKYPVLLNPQQPAYTITVAVPGLYLTPAPIKGSAAVFVKMMCGCPVTMGPPHSLWPAADFNVYATLMDAEGVKTNLALSYDSNQTGNSLFSAPLPSGEKQTTIISYTAIQKSTGNCGTVLQH